MMHLSVIHDCYDCGYSVIIFSYDFTVMFITVMIILETQNVICTRMTSSLGNGRVSTAVTAAQ